MKSKFLIQALFAVSLAGLSLSGCGDSNFVNPGGLGATAGVNQPPKIVLSSEVRAFDGIAEEPIVPDLNVSDDQLSLQSGVLSLSLSDKGNVTDAVFDVPDMSSIGSVEGDNTSSVSVKLESGASPSAIQEFLRDVYLSRGTEGQSGSGVIDIVLTDGREGIESVQVSFESVISVGPGGDESTVEGALESVTRTRNTGAIIEVAEGHNEPNDLSVSSSAYHDGLSLRGADKGRNVGTHASFRSSVGSTLDSIRIDAENVTVDGFNLFTGGSWCIQLSGRSRGATIKNCTVIYNGTPQPGYYGIHAPSPSDPKIEDCRISNWDIGLFLDGIPAEPFTNVKVTSNGFVRCNTGMLLQEPLGEFSLVIGSNGHSQNAESHITVTGTNPTRLFLIAAEYLTDDPVIIDGPIVVEADGSWWGANVPPTSPDQYQELNGAELRFEPIATSRLFLGFVP